MTGGAALVASFLVTLARPVTWPLALAAFLIRGGLVLLVAPILVLPSAVGLGAAIGPTLTEFVLAGWTPSTLVLVGGAAAVGLIWLVGGGLIAAAAESESIQVVALDDDIADPGGPNAIPAHDPDRVGRVLAVRLLAASPVALALVWGTTRLVDMTYTELTLPSATGTPLLVRVIVGAPDAIVGIAVGWLLAGMVGSVAARAVVLGGRGVGRSLVAALGWLVRHPLRAITLEVVPFAALLAVLVPSMAAAATSWDAVRPALSTDAGPVVGIGLVLLFVVLWIGGLALIAAISAWRAAVWTVALAGTFGVPGAPPPGDWHASPESGTLADLRPRGVDQDAR